jgi:precorrin-2 dehydrogenase / sirohydrochlorin ferrochelatase
VKSLFPMFVKLDGRQVLVVGAGRIGEPKIRGLLPTGAKIRVVARVASEAVRDWARKGEIVLEERNFVLPDLDGIFLLVVATSSRELNEFIFLEAQSRGILCNVVDVPEQCDFYYPAVVQRGDLQIAISTSGQSPSLAQRIRRQLARQFGPGYAHWVAELGHTRRKVLASNLDPERKRQLLQSLASAEAFEAMISDNSNGNGRSKVI